MSVNIYKMGPLTCSVCVPKELTREQVEAEVQRASPAGTERGWMVANDPTFKGGEPNPCPCNQHPGTRMHYLMEC